MNTAKIASLREAEYQIFFQHSSADGFITLARKDATTGQFSQYHYKPHEIAAHLTEYMGEDIFYSQNTFYKPQRRIENIRQLRSLYVDIDFYNLGLNANWVLGKLEYEYYGEVIPEPNLIIHSGQGIVLVWLIDPVPVQALPLWQAVQNYFNQQLQEIGADAKATDAARVFRLAGSTSSKNGKEVKVDYLHENRYELRDLQYEYLPELRPTPTKEQKSPVNNRKKVVRLFNTWTLNYARLTDIVKLIELRNFDVTGYREYMLFLYRYYSCHYLKDPSEALIQTLDLNDTFTLPLPKSEVIRATKSAEKAFEASSNAKANEIAISKGYPGAGYNISNSKLISWLDISKEEMTHLSTIIDSAEKKRRHRIRNEKLRREQGIRTREQYNADRTDERQALIDRLKEELSSNDGQSLRQLAKVLGVSKSTVANLKKDLA